MGRKAAISLAVCALIGVLGWHVVHRRVRSDKEPVILGHGGMGTRHWLPIDSERSVKRAMNHDVDGVEIDVQMTQDGILVACHNDSLTINESEKRMVADLRFTELADLKLKGWFSSEPIPSLNTLIHAEWRDSTVFSLDLKPYGLNSPFQMEIYRKAIIEFVDQHPNYLFLIESTDARLLKHLKDEAIDATLFYYSSSASKDMNTIKQLKLDGISIDLSLITEEEVLAFQNEGMLVMIWGTGSVFSNRKALQMKPDLIQTDDIPSMMRLLDRH